MRRIAYALSDDLVRASSQLPSNRNRSAIVHSLIKAFGLLSCASSPTQSNRLLLLQPFRATKHNLLAYHEENYIDYLLNLNNASLSVAGNVSKEDFGIEGDCPWFPALPHYVQQIAGASLTCATILKEGHADISINWDGGRHHAHKNRAAGFCYVADCVLAILVLKQPLRNRVMYLDLDLHFSDAVSEAFAGSISHRVLTMSIHYSEPGFFPTSPLSVLPEPTACDPYTLSLPLKRGASDNTFRRIWNCVELVRSAFCPDCVVVQCGVDGLAGDPCAIWNWSLASSEGSFGWCLSQVMKWGCKTLLLGGGGYNSPNAARAWSYVTALVLERPLSLDIDIPDHNSYPLYEPSFTLDVPPGNMRDENSEKYLQEVEHVYNLVAGKLRADRSRMDT